MMRPLLSPTPGTLKMHMLCILLGISSAAAIVSAAPIKGPYTVTHAVYENPLMDKTSHKLDGYFPSAGPSDGPFPLISYAHGLGGGDIATPIGYDNILEHMASFGYVIFAPRSCDIGCSDLATLPNDPVGFKHYYREQLKVFPWAQNQTGHPFDQIDWSKGTGIAGHSMGGQATLFSAGSGNPEAHNIKAAVMHHAYTHSFPAPTIPFLVFTGDTDHVAPADPMATNIFSATSDNSTSVRGLVNRHKTDHYEPNSVFPLSFNPLLAQFTVAWLKVHLDKTPSAFGFDFHEMIYGNSTDSVCAGGDGDMTECKINPF